MPLGGPKSRSPGPLKGEPRKGRTETPVEVTRRTPVEKFIQKTSDLRARTGAVDRLHDRLQEVATAVVKKATRTAKADGRKTLFDLIDKLDTVKIATLANIIRTWLEQRQQPRR